MVFLESQLCIKLQMASGITVLSRCNREAARALTGRGLPRRQEVAGQGLPVSSPTSTAT